jgi:hypothetical protein
MLFTKNSSSSKAVQITTIHFGYQEILGINSYMLHTVYTKCCKIFYIESCKAFVSCGFNKKLQIFEKFEVFY